MLKYLIVVTAVKAAILNPVQLPLNGWMNHCERSPFRGSNISLNDGVGNFLARILLSY